MHPTIEKDIAMLKELVLTAVEVINILETTELTVVKADESHKSEWDKAGNFDIIIGDFAIKRIDNERLAKSN